MKWIFVKFPHLSKVLLITGHQIIRFTPDGRNKDWHVLLCNLSRKVSYLLGPGESDDLQVHLGETRFVQEEKTGHFLF